MLDVFKRELHKGDIVAYAHYNRFRYCLIKSVGKDALSLIYPGYRYGTPPQTVKKEVRVNPQYRDLLLVTPDLFTHIAPLQLDLLMNERAKLKL